MYGNSGVSLAAEIGLIIGAQAMVNTAVGGSTMTDIADRMTGQSATDLLNGVTVIWDGYWNGMGTSGDAPDVDGYLDALGLAIDALGHQRFLVIPPILPYGSTTDSANGAIVQAVLEGMQSRWPGHVLQWHDALPLDDGMLPQSAFVDAPTDILHLSQTLAEAMAALIVDTLRERDWVEPGVATNGDDSLIIAPRSASLGAWRGDDTVQGNSGDDTVWGGAGDDRLSGAGGDDRLSGGTGQDSVLGDGGEDTLFGGGGQDTMHGQGGDDSLLGGMGDDWLWGGQGDDTVRGGNGSDLAWLSAGDDLYTDTAQAAEDHVWGGAGNDTLKGGGGSDRLSGQRGDDVLIGGSGNDLLTGGPGADSFVFWQGSGQDTVADFEAASDSIAFQGALDVTLISVSTGLRIDWDGGSVLLQGLAPDDLAQDDFIFL